MSSARAASAMIGLVVALTAMTVSAPPALAAGDQFQDSAVTTYELQPSRGVIHVTLKITMANKKSSTSRSYSCTGYGYDPYYGFYSYSTTCTTRTNYYYNRSSYWVEKDAKSLKVKASSGSISVKPGGADGAWRKANLKFSGLYYGQSRRITLQYDLPAGGPRSKATRRAGYTYASFCAAGPGTDTGEVRIVVPEDFELTGTSDLTYRRSGGKTTYSSGKLKSSPWKFYRCVGGLNSTSGYTTTSYPGASATTTVEAWKGDTPWTDVVTAAVTEDLPKLEAVLGPRPGGKDLTIHEGLAGSAPDVWINAASDVMTVSEDALDRAAVTDALASLWFPSDQFAAGWLKSGYQSWAARTAGVSDEPCSEPGPRPTGTRLDLTGWSAPGPQATQDERDMFAYKKQAACYLVAQTAAAIGPERMATVLAALRDQTDAWSPANAPAKRDAAIASWRDWLDLVVERGLIPAGADPRWAAELLKQYDTFDRLTPVPRAGLDPDAVDAHETARAGWHALQDLTGGKAPALILAALADWEDGTAQTAIDAANTAWSTVRKVETTLPDVDTDGGAVQQAVISASTQADLDAAVAMANTQVGLAADVADAMAVLAAPRDAIQELGLMGTTLPDPAPAIDAVARVDGAAATVWAQSTRSRIDGARDAGVQRAALTGGGGSPSCLLLVIVGFFVLRRRRRRRVAGGPGLVDAWRPWHPWHPWHPAWRPPARRTRWPRRRRMRRGADLGAHAAAICADRAAGRSWSPPPSAPEPPAG